MEEVFSRWVPRMLTGPPLLWLKFDMLASKYLGILQIDFYRFSRHDPNKCSGRLQAQARSGGWPRGALRRSTYTSAVLGLSVRHFYVDVLRYSSIPETATLMTMVALA
ncbi:hypothetical protein EVAR_99585_1 [Eumeta japonica]|uniref:Uncharacterized protein n=1 Tax=Eumeta variegata TaxID=151549 RepID=A0A4C1ZIE7_EUMVA|nr:hypothetical protein EVAR_99585_1 [Eumeta japonica]